jgi:HAD superfamily hydrolase (TIGR01484 family)
VKPISELTATEARGLSGFLFDLDDTLLDEGQLSEAAYSALFRLRESKLLLVAVTGRPAAWGELVARQWPVDGVVTENGPVAWYREDGRVRMFDAASPEERANRRRRLVELVASVRQAVPELEPADDVSGRISDFTFDIGEHQRAPEELIERAAALGHAAGATTFRSSVHLHFGFDRDDKASGVLRFLRQRLGFDATSARRRFSFIGDSENDAPCFAAFRTTIGVANLRGRPSLTPRFITRGARGAGFAEAAEQLCRLRQES